VEGEERASSSPEKLPNMLYPFRRKNAGIVLKPPQIQKNTRFSPLPAQIIDLNPHFWPEINGIF
jgi:hypothetical protein